MPEGPEIRRAADQIATVLEGQKLSTVFFGLKPLKPFEAKLQGQTITAIETRGKAILTRFDNGLTLYSHNQLYGRWEVLQPGEVSNSTRQLRIRLDTPLGSALLYSASDIEVLNEAEVKQHPFLSKLGPDLLSGEVTWQQIGKRLLESRFRNRQLGSFLTEQSFFAGLGNYLRCEALFLSGLHPATKPAQCSSKRVEALALQILHLPQYSYQTGGITYLPEAIDTMEGKYESQEPNRFWVFRRDGLPCRICDTPIKKINRGGQPCYICPNCQPHKG